MFESAQESQVYKISRLMEMDRLEDAMKMAQEYIQSFPDDSDAYGILGEIFLLKEQFKEALYWGEEALRIDPYSYFGWRVIVSCYYEQENWKKFDVLVDQALETLPEEEYFYFLKGNRLNKSGKFKLAREYFEKAAQFDPSNAVFVANCSYNYALLNEHELSLKYENQTLQLDVENEFVFLYLGWAAQKRGDIDKAVEFLTNAVKLDPQNKQIRREYLSILQNKYKIYRFFTFPSRMKPVHLIILWIMAWLIFRPLVILFVILYCLSHWLTKLMVHVKVFGWRK